jgi:Fe2+ or Zn2+ uptake regulation protein
VDASTAWFNGETFTSGTLGAAITYPSGYDWSGTIPVIHTNVATNVSTAGNVLGFSTSTAADLTEGSVTSINTTKLFPTSLSGIVYAKMSSYHCTRGTGIVFKNTAGNTVFGFGSKDNKAANSNLRYTLDGFAASGGYLVGNPTLVEFTSASFMRGQWYDWEMVIDLNNKKLIKLTATKNGGGTASISNISLTNGGSLTGLNIVTANYNAAAGLDNVTIGELAPDKIANLSGATELQTLSSQVNLTYSLSATADISSLALTGLVVKGGNIVWSISDWGGLSSADQALISITRNPANHAEATLTTSSATSADATITLQAQLDNGTPLTKTVLIKALTVSGLKSSVSTEITNANSAIAAITDNNPYLTSAKTTLSTAITAAQAVVDNANATLSKTTIYNTLNLFVEKGAVLQLNIDEKNARYDADIKDHAHFICKSCGKVHDIFDLKTQYFELPNIEGFEIQNVEISYTGICSSCKGTN